MIAEGICTICGSEEDVLSIPDPPCKLCPKCVGWAVEHSDSPNADRFLRFMQRAMKEQQKP